MTVTDVVILAIVISTIIGWSALVAFFSVPLWCAAGVTSVIVLTLIRAGIDIDLGQ